jgi:hypothetical protein
MVEEVLVLLEVNLLRDGNEEAGGEVRADEGEDLPVAEVGGDGDESAAGRLHRIVGAMGVLHEGRKGPRDLLATPPPEDDPVDGDGPGVTEDVAGEGADLRRRALGRVHAGEGIDDLTAWRVQSAYATVPATGDGAAGAEGRQAHDGVEGAQDGIADVAEMTFRRRLRFRFLPFPRRLAGQLPSVMAGLTEALPLPR